MKLESAFQREVIDELKTLFPGCVVLKNDAGYIQGFPDLTVLYKSKWAVLECKKSRYASHQPNQDWYVNKLKEMSYANFIYPENKEQIFYELQQTFKSRRRSRDSKR